MRALSRLAAFSSLLIVLPGGTSGQSLRRVYVEMLPCVECRVALLDSLGVVLAEYGCDSAGDVRFQWDKSNLHASRIDLLRTDGVLYRKAWRAEDTAAARIVFLESERLPVAIGEVRVSANKTAVRDDGRTISYRVQDDPSARVLGSTEEVLRRVPMVSVTADGTPLIRGGSNVKVLVNGKEMVGVPNAQVLSMVNPSDLVRVEVQTVPGVRYASGGTDGVINLVTRRAVEVQLSGMLNAGLGSAGSHLMGVVTAPLGKGWALTATTGNLVAYNRLAQQQRIVLFDTVEMEVEEKGRSVGGYLSGGVTVSHTSDAHQASFGVWAYHNRLGRRMRGEQLGETSEVEIRSLEANTSYLGGGRYSYTGVRNLTLEFSSYGVYIPVENSYARASVERKSAASARGVMVGVDATWRALRQLSLEAGAGYTQSWYARGYACDASVWHALAHGYAEVEYQPWRKLSLRAGGRYEYYLLSQLYQREFHDALFNASASFKFTYRSTLTLQYSRRGLRPSYSQLTSVASYASPFYVQVGNVGLNKGLRHRAEVTYSQFWGMHYLRLGAYYGRDYDAAMRYAHLEGAIRSTYVNGDQSEQLGGEAWLTLSFLRGDLSLNLGGGGHYVSLRYASEQATGAEWTCSFNGTYRFLKNWQLAIFGSYVSPRIDLQGRRSLYWYSNVALYRSFLDGDLRLALSGDNLFTYPMRVEQRVAGERFSYVNRMDYYNMGVRMLLSWRFGKQTSPDMLRKNAVRDVYNSTL